MLMAPMNTLSCPSLDTDLRNPQTYIDNSENIRTKGVPKVSWLVYESDYETPNDF